MVALLDYVHKNEFAHRRFRRKNMKFHNNCTQNALIYVKFNEYPVYDKILRGYSH